MLVTGACKLSKVNYGKSLTTCWLPVWYQQRVQPQDSTAQCLRAVQGSPSPVAPVLRLQPQAPSNRSPGAFRASMGALVRSHHQWLLQLWHGCWGPTSGDMTCHCVQE